MSKGKRMAVRRSAAEWGLIVSRFERSGQTREQFCSAEDLALSTFSLWRRKLGRSGQRFEGRGAAAFVELADAPTASPAWEAELELGDGVVLRLRRSSRC